MINRSLIYKLNIIISIISIVWGIIVTAYFSLKQNIFQDDAFYLISPAIVILLLTFFLNWLYNKSESKPTKTTIDVAMILSLVILLFFVIVTFLAFYVNPEAGWLYLVGIFILPILAIMILLITFIVTKINNK